MNRTFWIGVYPGLTENHLDFVIETLTDYINARRVAPAVALSAS
jgi:CDP-6-deoxy-D-xylo-4-hexulose-3-dehydrase